MICLISLVIWFFWDLVNPKNVLPCSAKYSTNFLLPIVLGESNSPRPLRSPILIKYWTPPDIRAFTTVNDFNNWPVAVKLDLAGVVVPANLGFFT